MILAEKCSASESKVGLKLWGKRKKWWAIWCIHLTVHYEAWSILMTGRVINQKKMCVWVCDLYFKGNRSGIVPRCGGELYVGHSELVPPGCTTHLPPPTQMRYFKERALCTSNDFQFTLIQVSFTVPGLLLDLLY